MSSCGLFFEPKYLSSMLKFIEVGDYKTYIWSRYLEKRTLNVLNRQLERRVFYCSDIINLLSLSFLSKRDQMPEDYYCETAEVSAVGISLHELLEYYRTLCQQ